VGTCFDAAGVLTVPIGAIIAQLQPITAEKSFKPDGFAPSVSDPFEPLAAVCFPDGSLAMFEFKDAAGP
jgi:hypothetical protein